MKYLAAYFLAQLGSKRGKPTADDLKKILTSVSIEVEEDRVMQVVEALNGKDLEELIEQGLQKMTSVPSGATAAIAATVGAAPATVGRESKEDAKAAEKEEAAEESDEDLGFGLFD
ncbi:60S acidic ribosomal protein P2 [Galdieria sulphuraria]|uniref:60S acidic ribosomal protein P2 n=1 Tax=Galdieria sulphuraria TaxID=130081 RepID=M2W1D9_GALSU|nr:60S acidic ribosomal protein P2 [Galdieria sulphuraria]EME29471.1 60S acidic ribosomal protein P2 [Galdieria sulphuraria]GJD06016.1 60S acidic ribosomal protein P2 [Galdieria sulphuraria]|eukprot:XP_005705991.1 60S acidic ribosomal protein P2 [Galdieria sulphuraria]